MERILIMFMFYGIIGWIWETSVVSLKNKKYINRGFLHGPVIPIYGFATVTFMISIDIIESYLPQNYIIRMLSILVYVALVTSIWEYVTSALLEKIFHTRWWDYSYRKFNIKGRIALDISIGWGIGGYLLWRLVNTPLIGAMEHMPEVAVIIILTIFYALFIVDSIVTIKELITLKHIMDKMEVISSQLSELVLYNIEHLNSEIEEKREEIKKIVDEGKQYLDEKILQLIAHKDATLTEGQKFMMHTFNGLLERSKYFSRFYQNYPSADSEKFRKNLLAVRYKRKH